MQKKIKIVIADDHPVARKGYMSIIEEYPNYIITGEAANGVELLEIVKTDEPDIVLLDIEMSVMDGFKAHAELRKKHPAVKVIIASMHFEDSFVSHFFMNGANGYLPKGGDPDHLPQAIDAVMKDNYFFNASISKIILSDILSDKKNNALKSIDLNHSQKEIMKMICAEKSNKEIAASLNLSIHTIDYHRRIILEKTKQSSVIGLVKYAIKNGITRMD